MGSLNRGSLLRISLSGVQVLCFELLCQFNFMNEFASILLKRYLVQLSLHLAWSGDWGHSNTVWLCIYTLDMFCRVMVNIRLISVSSVVVASYMIRLPSMVMARLFPKQICSVCPPSSADKHLFWHEIFSRSITKYSFSNKSLCCLYILNKRRINGSVSV